MTAPAWWLVLWAAAVTVPVAIAVLVRPGLRRRSARARLRWLRVKAGSTPTGRSARDHLRQSLLASPVRVSAGAGLAAFAAGYAAGGPVLALVLATYAVGGMVMLRRTVLRRDQADARQEVVDAVAGLAADLRAGLGVARALDAAGPMVDRAVAAGGEAGLVATRIGCAVTVSEASGAPLAEVLERLDTHLRAADRARTTASAHAAGAHASAGLLAVMPVAGVGLGTVIGVDPWHVLLRTTLGAAALLLAMILQLLGLVWAARLARVEVSL